MSSTAQTEIACESSAPVITGPTAIVACICGGYGFPHGTASTQRILLVGKALVESGCKFTVWHCGPSPTLENREARGQYEGIEFEYLGNALRRPASKVRRLIIYTRAMLQLPARIRSLRGNGCVYLYPQGGVLGLYAGLLCRLLRVSLVQELGEWWDGIDAASRLTQYSFRGPLFWLSDGAVVISDEIARRVLERTWTRSSYRIYQLPAVADTARWNSMDEIPPLRSTPATFLWCGLVGGYLSDIRFVMESLARVRQTGIEARLILCGPCDRQAQAFISSACSELGLQKSSVVLAGFVSQDALVRHFHSASALVLPMPDTDRSWTRSPNKLPEYLASGTPVITSPVGEIGKCLQHLRTGYLVAPGDVAAFAGAMREVAENPIRAREIGIAGRDLSLKSMDFRLHSAPLAEFFSCFQKGSPAALPRPGASRLQRLQFRLRKATGWAISSCMIAGGSVRRKMRSIDSQAAITPLYFHNPSAKLFRRCIEYLIASDCVFLSLAQVCSFLRGEGDIPKRAVWLSCDDGWKEIALTMLPLLRRHHVPMTIFVPTQLASGGPVWWRVCRVFRRELAQLGISDPHQLWEIPNWRRLEVLKALFKRVDVPALGDDLLSREQIRAIAQYPEITIGSHSSSHPLLWRCTTEEVEQEMVESKRILEQWIGKLVIGFAYPFGYGGQREADCARAAGYQVAATTTLGRIEASNDPLLLPRFCVADEMSLAEAICSVTGAWPEFSKSLKRRLPDWALALVALSTEDGPDGS